MKKQVIGGKSHEEISSQQGQPRQEFCRLDHLVEPDYLSRRQYDRAASSSDPEIRDRFRAREESRNLVEQTTIDREIQKRMRDRGKLYRENNRVVHQAHRYVSQPATTGPGGPRR